MFSISFKSLANLLKSCLWRFKYPSIKVKEKYTKDEKEILWKFFHKELLQKKKVPKMIFHDD